MKSRLFLLSISIALWAAVFIPDSYGQEPVIPAYTGYVNDFAGVLSGENKNALTVLAGELERKTTAQIAIVIINTVRPWDIEDYAVKLFEKWGIGRKNRDNGVLLLVALRDRKVRIEVGYGLEGAIPDAIAKIIINDYILPSFKAGNYNTGIAKGAVAIAKLVAKEYNVEVSEFGSLPADVPLPKEPTFLQSILRLIFTILLIIIILSFRMGFFWLLFMPGTYRRRGGYWYGNGYGGNSGGFSGGFGGFGGGL
ncbi:MAG: hypothetical protein A2Z72_01770, partial [Omnitrophica bacterium RBG_13_46_9]